MSTMRAMEGDMQMMERFMVGHEIQIRGMNFCRVAVSNLRAGDNVSFQPETGNANDPNAIRACHAGEFIGYVARDLAPKMKQFLNDGGEIVAQFSGEVYNDVYNGFSNLKIIRSSQS